MAIKQVEITGYNRNEQDKNLKLEAVFMGEEDGCVDVVTFVDFDLTVNRKDLLEAISFLIAHQ